MRPCIPFCLTKKMIENFAKIGVEMPGIEPGAFHMQSERSTTELHPRHCYLFLIFNSLFWKWTFYMTVLIKHWHDIYNSREATEHGVNLYSTVAFQFAPRARLIQTYFNWWDSGSEQGVTLFMAISYYAICILARRHFWQHMFSLRFTTIFFLIEDG